MMVNEIASFCGISRQQFYQIKSGVRPVPQSVAERLSALSGVSSLTIRQMSPQEFLSFAKQQTTIKEVVRTLSRAESAIEEVNSICGCLRKFLT